MAAQRSGDKKVRTVLGDIDPRELGKTDVHEHLLMRSPLLRGEELDDREKSTQEAVELRQTGIEALVELTTIGLGRDPRGHSVRMVACQEWRTCPGVSFLAWPRWEERIWYAEY